MSGGERPEKLGVVVRDRLRHDIVFGDLRAGERLRLAVLKDHYEASSSTLRESLNFLTAEGLVISRGQSGFFVAPVSHENLADVTDARILVESHCLGLSLESGDMAWETELVAAHHRLQRMEEALAKGDEGVKIDWHYFDMGFHQALVAACGSEELLAIHKVLASKYMRYQVATPQSRIAGAAMEHRELFELALSRETKRAKELVRTHLLRGKEFAAAALPRATTQPDHS